MPNLRVSRDRVDFCDESEELVDRVLVSGHCPWKWLWLVSAGPMRLPQCGKFEARNLRASAIAVLSSPPPDYAVNLTHEF
jgi:hypothetical protein